MSNTSNANWFHSLGKQREKTLKSSEEIGKLTALVKDPMVINYVTMGVRWEEAILSVRCEP
jgi:hypothetical protein